MDERIDEIAKEITNKIDTYMEGYLEETFALLRRMTQTTYTSRFFNGVSETKYEILGIIRKYFGRTYDELKQTNDPFVVRRLNVDKIKDEIDNLLKMAIRKGLNRLEYELPDILRETYRGMDRSELRQQEYRIMNRVPEYFDEFRFSTSRFSLRQLEEAKDEYIKFASKNFGQREKENVEIKIDPKVNELISKISLVHFQARKLNNPEEFDKYTKIRIKLQMLLNRGLFIDRLDQASKKLLTDMVNDYLTLVKNDKAQNSKFKPVEEKQEEAKQPSAPTASYSLNRLDKKIEDLENDEFLKSNQNESKTISDPTLREYIKRIDDEIEESENLRDETKRGL